ncbi:MAG: cysteine methyltransferase [Bacteroidales bacterium]|nr:cysteine methyltransferase [Bacteroidales bacterium]
MRFDGVAFAREVKDIVTRIPKGKVLSYGDVAWLAGAPNHARQVGKVLAMIGKDSETPCHRVVNASGRCAPHWPAQHQLLHSEGVRFLSSGAVNMALCRWHPEDDLI